MRKLLFIFAVCFINAAFSQDVSFSIDGNVNGLNSTVKLHLYTNGQYQLYKSVDAVNGKFSFSGSLPAPQFALLQLSDSVKKNIFLGNEKMELSGNIKAPNEIKISGSSLSDAY